jgi:hypothetical protein
MRKGLETGSSKESSRVGGRERERERDVDAVDAAAADAAGNDGDDGDEREEEDDGRASAWAIHQLYTCRE